jgi:hypothetical protein
MVTHMYKYQIARLDRMFKFITMDERFMSLDMELQRDIILSFFMHCYHLKDWLYESGVGKEKVGEKEVPKTRKVPITKVDHHINSKIGLKLCQKLTNSTKHLSSTDPRSPQLYSWKEGELPSPIGRAYDPFARNEEESEYLTISVNLKDDDKYGKEIPCSSLMRQCMEEWNEFLQREGLERLKI